jgi:hypothetical protein
MRFVLNPFTDQLDVASISGSGMPQVEFITGNSGGQVGTDGSFNINLFGDNTTGINVVGNPGTSTLTIDGLASSTTQIGTTRYATNVEAAAQTLGNVALTPDNISSLFSTNPLPSSQGGTGLSSPAAHQLIVTNGSSPYSLLGVAGNGEIPIGSIGSDPVLANITSTGSSITITNGPGTINIDLAGGGVAIQTIATDSGSATGTTVTLTAINASNQCGSSVLFHATGSTVDLNITDSHNSNYIGLGAGNLSSTSSLSTVIGYNAAQAVMTGAENVLIGCFAGQAMTAATENVAVGPTAMAATTISQFCVAIGVNALLLNEGDHNTAIGHESLANLLTGSNNTVLGAESGFNYTTSESTNLLLDNPGVIGDNLVTRIGRLQTTCFAAGIAGNSVSNQTITTIDSSTGQLGNVTLVPVANGGTGAASFTAHSLLLGQSTSAVTALGAAINGQLPIGSTGVDPVLGTLTAGSGIAISNGAGTITISALTGGFAWSDTSGTFTAAVENGYFITATSTATLPASPVEGDSVSFIVDTTQVLTITANTGQMIRIGTAISAAAGTAASNARGDSISLVYRATGTTWFSLAAPQGTWTVT